MVKVTVRAVSVLMLATLGAAPARAQERNTPTRELIIAGAGIGAVGYLSGMFAGRQIEKAWRCGSASRCRPTGIGELLLAVAGGSTGVATGVHLGNHQLGDFSDEWLYSLGIGAAGAAAIAAASR